MNAVEIRLEALRLATPFVTVPCYPIVEPVAQDTAKSIVAIAGAFEAFLNGSDKEPVEHKPHVERHTAPKMSVTHGHDEKGPEIKPTEQPAPAAAAKTVDDVRQAFTAYVGKAGGRTAGTAKAILTEMGLGSFKEANPKQCAVLCEKYAA